MPPLRSPDGLVTDVFVDLTSEAGITQAETEGIGGDGVEEFGGGDTLELLGRGRECPKNRIDNVGQHLVVHRSLSLLVSPLLRSPRHELDGDADSASDKKDIGEGTRDGNHQMVCRRARRKVVSHKRGEDTKERKSKAHNDELEAVDALEGIGVMLHCWG